MLQDNSSITPLVGTPIGVDKQVARLDIKRFIVDYLAVPVSRPIILALLLQDLCDGEAAWVFDVWARMAPLQCSERGLQSAEPLRGRQRRVLDGDCNLDARVDFDVIDGLGNP